MGFSQDVRAATGPDHAAAERSPFVGALLSGGLDRRAHVEMLRALHPVYRALEGTLIECGEEASVALFDHRRLDRRDRIADDLRSFGQDPEASVRTAPPGSRAYVDLVLAASVSPQRLLAHHYTRYLGDMAGGRIIASRLSSEYGIDSSRLTYYDFSALGDVHHYRARYKALLDLVPWSARERDEFIDECRLAYRANARLFDDLACISGAQAPSDPPAVRFFARERLHAPR